MGPGAVCRRRSVVVTMPTMPPSRVPGGGARPSRAGTSRPRGPASSPEPCRAASSRSVRRGFPGPSPSARTRPRRSRSVTASGIPVHEDRGDSLRRRGPRHLAGGDVGRHPHRRPGCDLPDLEPEIGTEGRDLAAARGSPAGLRGARREVTGEQRRKAGARTHAPAACTPRGPPPRRRRASPRASESEV